MAAIVVVHYIILHIDIFPPSITFTFTIIVRCISLNLSQLPLNARSQGVSQPLFFWLLVKKQLIPLSSLATFSSILAILDPLLSLPCRISCSCCASLVSLLFIALIHHVHSPLILSS